MLWNHINGLSGTRYFQRARGHKCHSVNSQCAASKGRGRPENESASKERERLERYRETQREWQNQIKSMPPHNTSSAHLYLSYFKAGDLVSIMSALFGATWEKYQRMHFLNNQQTESRIGIEYAVKCIFETSSRGSSTCPLRQRPHKLRVKT